MSPEEIKRHDAAAMTAARAIIEGGRRQEDLSMVILESTVAGLLFPEPRDAAEYLDVMTERVLDRLHRAAERVLHRLRRQRRALG